MAQAKHLEWTEIDGQQVIVTQGGYIDRGPRIYGLFASIDDAMSDDPDSAAVGTVSGEKLTAAQREMAQRNSERLSD